MIRPALLLCASLLPLASLAQAAPAGHARAPAARVAAANRAALHEPDAEAFNGAVQVYPWAEGAIYRLYAAPERVTDIMLQPGETLVSVAAGDTARWTVGDTTSASGAAKRTHILIKPFAAGLRTNLVITTDRRTYHLQLESHSGAAMSGLSWTYPRDELMAIERARAEAKAAAPVAAGLDLEELHFGYEISGDHPRWRPLRAFDDGHQTFIEFPVSIGQDEAPPLFITGTKGEAELVNYRMSGRFYIVDRLFDRAELRLGKDDQKVVRIRRTGEDRRARGRRSS